MPHVIPLLIRMAEIKKARIIKYWGDCVATGSLIYCGCLCKVVQLLRPWLISSTEVKDSMLYFDLGIPFQVIHLTDMSTR